MTATRHGCERHRRHGGTFLSVSQDPLLSQETTPTHLRLFYKKRGWGLHGGVKSVPYKCGPTQSLRARLHLEVGSLQVSLVKDQQARSPWKSGGPKSKDWRPCWNREDTQRDREVAAVGRLGQRLE